MDLFYSIISAIDAGAGSTSAAAVAEDFTSLNNFLFALIQAGSIVLSLVYIIRILSNQHSAWYYIKRIFLLIVLNTVALNIQSIVAFVK